MSQRFPREFLDELLAKIDITELIDRRVTLKKAGTNYVACCPFHNEKTPSFSVSPQKQFYHCFGCGAHGNAIGFLMAYDRLEFPEAVEELANHLGVPIPQQIVQSVQQPQVPLYNLLEKSARYYQSQLNHTQTAQVYLHKRGLTAEIIKQFNIGYAPAGWDNLRTALKTNQELTTQLIQTGMLIKNDGGKIYDRFRQRIMVPIKDTRGRVIAFGGRTLGDDTPKYLNSPETALFHKGSELYGLYEAKQSNNTLPYVLVVEGYMDVIALHQFGITQAVATLGTATSQKHLQRLFRYTQEIIFCFDGDHAGEEAAWRALENSLSVMQDGLQIRFMFLPKQEDPDSLIRKIGAEQFKQHILAAMPLADFFFKRFSSQINVDSMDGKAKLAKIARDYLKKIRNGVFQQLMLEKLASLVGMSVESLNNYQEPANTPAVTAKPHSQDKKALPPVSLAIALLLQYPHIAQHVPLDEKLQETNLPGVKILTKLLKLLQANPTITLGSILEHWRGSKVADTLGKLAFHPLVIPADGKETLLIDILKKIPQLAQTQQLEDLHSNLPGLTEQEKRNYFKLIQQQHGLADTTSLEDKNPL